MAQIGWLQGITLGLAVLGALLGIINTWSALDKNRLKLRVTPLRAIPLGDMDARLTFGIEVVNLSSFAVTVKEVGLKREGTDSRAAYTRPVLIDGGDWPRTLEPRASVTVYGQRPDVLVDGHRISVAYASTACGHTQTGTSPALEQLRRAG